jgi:hypothetical protein
MLDPQLAFSLSCASPAELQVVATAALSAQADYRAGKGSKAEPAKLSASVMTATTTDLIKKGLQGYPPNPQKTLLQKLLFDAPAGTWVSFDSIKTSFVQAGLKGSQASAALRDLSWQLGQVFPADTLEKLDANICIFAERMRSGGAFNYRLTEAGRAALDHLIQN